MKPAVADRLNGMLQAAGYATEAVASEIDTDPFRFA